MTDRHIKHGEPCEPLTGHYPQGKLTVTRVVRSDTERACNAMLTVVYDDCGHEGELRWSSLRARCHEGHRCPVCARKEAGRSNLSAWNVSRQIHALKEQAARDGRTLPASLKVEDLDWVVTRRQDYGITPPEWPAPPSVVKMMRDSPWERFR